MIGIRRSAAVCGVAAALLLATAACGSSSKNASAPAGNANPSTSAAPSSSAPAPSSSAPGTSGGGSGSAASTSSSGGSSGGSSPNATVPRCHTTDLSARLAPAPGGAAAGHILMTLILTNKSSHVCHVYGYPGALLLGASHQPLPTTVARDPNTKPFSVALIPNGSASASMLADNGVPGAGEPETGPCEPNAYSLEITPPDETTQLVIPLSGPHPWCNHGDISFSVFVPGVDGTQNM